MKQERYTLPAAPYVLGCPRLMMDEWFDEELYKEGLNTYQGHKFFTIRTGRDGFFSVYDMEEIEGVENPESCDELQTDVACISILPYAIIESLGTAWEWGKELVLETDKGLEPWEITVNRDDNGKIIDVDIEFYKLVISMFHPDKRFAEFD